MVDTEEHMSNLQKHGLGNLKGEYFFSRLSADEEQSNPGQYALWNPSLGGIALEWKGERYLLLLFGRRFDLNLLIIKYID